jgi:mannose-6-phosphate isomerase-like protein (cupin superfamily)
MIVKLLKDHHLKESPTCGELREILTAADYSQTNIAIALDIKPTKAHYHDNFDEIYFVLDGSISLKFYEVATARNWSQKLMANELCVISKGTHHKVIEASKTNRLCIITVPHFDAADEHLSDKI